MMRPRVTKRATNFQRGAALLVVLFAAFVVATLGACGTILDIAPDPPLGGEGGEGGNGSSDGAAVDGAGLPDFDAGDASTACGLSVDRKTISMGDVRAGMVRMETLKLGSVLDTPTDVTITVTGPGFAADMTMLTVPPSSQELPFMVSFTGGGAIGLHPGTLTLSWSGGCQVTVPLSATTVAAGSVAISPATLDLGGAACGAAPAPGMIQVTAADGGSWSASVSSGPFAIVPSGGTLVAGTTDILVTSMPLLPKEDPKQFTADITLSIAGQPPRTIPVTALSLGGKLAFQPNDVTLTKTEPSRIVALSNTGTQAVQVLLSIAPPFAISPSKVIVLPGQAKPVTVSTVTASSGAAVQLANVAPNNGSLCFAGPLTVRQ